MPQGGAREEAEKDQQGPFCLERHRRSGVPTLCLANSLAPGHLVPSLCTSVLVVSFGVAAWNNTQRLRCLRP